MFVFDIVETRVDIDLVYDDFSLILVDFKYVDYHEVHGGRDVNSVYVSYV